MRIAVFLLSASYGVLVAAIVYFIWSFDVQVLGPTEAGVKLLFCAMAVFISSAALVGVLQPDGPAERDEDTDLEDEPDA